MSKSLPAWMRTGESLTDLIEGRLSSADGELWPEVGDVGDASDR